MADDFEIDLAAKRVTHRPTGCIFDIDDSSPAKVTARGSGRFQILDPYCHKLRYDAIALYLKAKKAPPSKPRKAGQRG